MTDSISHKPLVTGSNPVVAIFTIQGREPRVGPADAPSLGGKKNLDRIRKEIEKCESANVWGAKSFRVLM